MRKLRPGEVVVVGRCPPQGPDSTIPLKAPVFEKAYQAATENNIPSSVGPTLLTTITFAEMSTRPCRQMYDQMFLESKPWKTIYAVMISEIYRSTRASRPEVGIFNTAMGRHGSALPYSYTRIEPQQGHDRLGQRAQDSERAPASRHVPDRNERASAICTLLGKFEFAYGIMERSGRSVAVREDLETLVANSTVYTRLMCIVNQTTYRDKLKKACEVIALVEEIDSASLTARGW
ncbi:hypothetical protein MAPG_10571 [Magnaporthiopsis poae ATCC 64411]|uniref:Uncharacterized protein n=1 Tax=Magnaporthiopsis poae (strain ATCC 64411 / 73-15) TaxID=644358 RepID=A0A0C4ECY2_MAGP6|nr:hypothetical protein MAPG_10571 [Magnaporthiopsis poae ATCC 64411]